MTGAWLLFPEYKRDAKRTTVQPVKYVEIDWRDGRTIIVKQERHLFIPTAVTEEPNKRSRKKKRDEEEAG
jgi:hypothetical protein